MEQVAQGTVGLRISLELVGPDGARLDTRGLTAPGFNVRIYSPLGTEAVDTWTPAASADGRTLDYDTQAGELDRLGTHEVHAEASATGGKVYRSHRPFCFEVVAP